MDILEILAVFAVGVIPNVVASLTILRDPQHETFYGKSTTIFTHLAQSFSAIVVLFYIASRQPDGLRDLGVGFSGLGWGEVGICYGGYFLVSIAAAIQRRRQPAGQANPLHRAFAHYRSIPERLVYFLSMAVGILAEELVYRGYLVLWLGSKTGYLPVWVAISILLSVTIHLYQGSSRILFHFMIASTFVLMVILAGNLALVLVFHLFINTISLVRFWRKLDTTLANQAQEVAEAA